MYEVVTTCSSVLAQPWSCPASNSINSSPVMSEGNYTTMTIKHEDSGSMRAMGSFQSEFDGSTLDTHHNINEDFLIGDLSEFSNEDIAAPIQNGNYSPHQSDDNHTASTIKSDCTAYTAQANSSVSALLEGSTALDCKTYSTAVPSNELKDSSISLPCQDETGFEWLASLGDENLIYGASNLGMDPFLLNDSEPFVDYNGVMKHSDYEDAVKAKDMLNMGHISITGTHHYEQDGPEDKMWHDDVKGLKDCNDATLFVPLATGSRSVRTKRPRSSGWSSTSSILCNNWSESTSPTNSLNSTSQIMMPTPQYSGNPSFICNQQEGYITTSHQSMEVNISSGPTSNQNSDNPFCDMNKGSKFGSTCEQWSKEEFDNSREESVGNYSTGGGLQPRRCTHCQSQKTPQWRAGPQGPKTLCNACGVRYKSGRLFDEYRPAKSPTFLSYKHSNSHKKVMEMRRRKSFHYNQQQQHVMHHVRTPSRKHADIVNQQFVSKLKIKLNNPANSEPPSTHFSDITLISTRNVIESPSSLILY